MSKSNLFTSVPSITISRSKQNLAHGNKTSMSVGRLYPVDIVEVLPGDTFKYKANMVSRVTSAFLRPVIDNLYMDVYSFYVPARILYDRYEETFHENKRSAWAELDPPPIPSFTSSGVVSEKTVADYLGLPLGYDPSKTGDVSVLPFRAFAKIWNEWFRNENVVDPVNVLQGETSATEALNNNPWSPINYTGQLPFVSKKKDVFTSGLPAPQKGLPVTFSLSGSAPVEGTITVPPTNIGNGTGPSFNPHMVSADGSTLSLRNYSLFGSPRAGGAYYALSGEIKDVAPVEPKDFALQLSTFQNNAEHDLSADLSQVSTFNVNDLRLAFALQKVLEADARGGTRFSEFLSTFYGVIAPDARLQRPEFLGGRRIPLNVQQVAQTNTQDKDADGSVESPLASLGGYSLSNGRARWSKSFVEFGYVITVACIRQIHSYSQGFEPFWKRLKREDFYNPKFANLGEQPIPNYSLYAQGSEDDNKPFAYNEAWYDYRYVPDRITGEMRPQASNTLDVWHFGDNYSSLPTLTPGFVNETPVYVDRALAVPSTSQDQFLVDFYFDIEAFRPMPVRSYPGLIDHH